MHHGRLRENAAQRMGDEPTAEHPAGCGEEGSHDSIEHYGTCAAVAAAWSCFSGPGDHTLEDFLALGGAEPALLTLRLGFVYCCHAVLSRARHRGEELHADRFSRMIMERRRFLVGHCKAFRRDARRVAGGALQAQQ